MFSDISSALLMSTFKTISTGAPALSGAALSGSGRTHFTEMTFIGFHQLTFSFQVLCSFGEQLEVAEMGMKKSEWKER